MLRYFDGYTGIKQIMCDLVHFFYQREEQMQSQFTLKCNKSA